MIEIVSVTTDYVGLRGQHDARLTWPELEAAALQEDTELGRKYGFAWIVARMRLAETAVTAFGGTRIGMSHCGQAQRNDRYDEREYAAEDAIERACAASARWRETTERRIRSTVEFDDGPMRKHGPTILRERVKAATQWAIDLVLEWADGQRAHMRRHRRSEGDSSLDDGSIYHGY